MVQTQEEAEERALLHSFFGLALHYTPHVGVLNA